MESLKSDPILEFKPDTLQNVRSMYGLDGPGRLADAVKVLRGWLNMQPHILKKDFSDQYLEVVIISCKGSVEKAKRKIDKYCTFRTLYSKFFDISNVKEELKGIFEVFRFAILPKCTDDYYRVFFAKAENSHLCTSQIILNTFKYVMMMCDYLLSHDYYHGCVVILNFSDVNLMDIITHLNINDLSIFFSLLVDSYGMRMKGLHLVTSSKVVDMLVSIMKQILSAKIGSRIQVHNSMDTIDEFVPKELLPSDFGGKEKNIYELQKDWIEVISSEGNMSYLKDMRLACTDESRRPKELALSDQLMGLQGTFRALNVD